MNDLLAVMDAHDINRAVLVQASVYGYDNDAILDALASAPDRFRAVVMAPNDPAILDGLARTPGVCGVRLNLTDFNAHGDQQNVIETACAIADAGLCIQIQARPDDALAVVNALGDTSVIIDHFGRPDLEAPRDIKRLKTLADRPNTWLKVSGAFRLNMVGDWRTGAELLRPLTGAFGADRLLWGSDWPFINTKDRRPHYRETLDLGRALITDIAASQMAAARLFGWAP